MKADKTLLLRCRLFAAVGLDNERLSIAEALLMADAFLAATDCSPRRDGAVSSASDVCDLTTTLLRTCAPIVVIQR